MGRITTIVMSVIVAVVSVILLPIITAELNTVLADTDLDLYFTGTSSLLELVPLMIVVGILGLAGFVGFSAATNRLQISGTRAITSIVAGYVVVLVAIILLPIIVDTIVVELFEPGELTDFTGSQPLLELFPLIYTVGVLALGGGIVFQGVRGGGDKS